MTAKFYPLCKTGFLALWNFQGDLLEWISFFPTESVRCEILVSLDASPHADSKGRSP